MNLLPENEFTEFEGRQYSNPQVGVDETNSFIDKFRNAQVQDTNKISADTRALGTNIPTQMGGLTGSKSYWTSRYQTPQTNAVVQDLRTAAQAQALNQVLANEQAKWKKRYQDAYNAYQKSAYDKANTPTTDPGETRGGVDENPTDDDTTRKADKWSLRGVRGYLTMAPLGFDGQVYMKNLKTGEVTWKKPQQYDLRPISIWKNGGYPYYLGGAS